MRRVYIDRSIGAKGMSCVEGHGSGIIKGGGVVAIAAGSRIPPSMWL